MLPLHGIPWRNRSEANSWLLRSHHYMLIRQKVPQRLNVILPSQRKHCGWICGTSGQIAYSSPNLVLHSVPPEWGRADKLYGGHDALKLGPS